ncbi:MAG: thioredoxin-dependent thiol peroxidase [Verrucomicrobiales bacterium]|nr:thioredoxin-dependent thiol peroxidase [Verrucomicrobiales bacterium]
MSLELKLQVGDVAPDFTAETQDGTRVSLRQFRGRPVVLYFYPKDDTPGCTREACGFRDEHAALLARGAVVLGVSPDSVKSHAKFAAKFSLPFPLVADLEHQIAEKYGVWGEKVFMGRRYQGVHRVTFLVGADGRLVALWPKVKPDEHAAEVLAALAQI